MGVYFDAVKDDVHVLPSAKGAKRRHELQAIQVVRLVIGDCCSTAAAEQG